MIAEKFTMTHLVSNETVVVILYKYSNVKQMANDVELAANVCLSTYTKTKIS